MTHIESPTLGITSKMGLCCEIDPRLTNITYDFATDLRFADFTQSGVMVMGQHGTTWVTATDATGVMVCITLIRDCYKSLFQLKLIIFCFDDFIIHICEESDQKFAKDTRISIHFFK